VAESVPRHRRPQVTVRDCSGKRPEGTTPLQLGGHDGTATVNALAFQRAGTLLASGGSDGKLLLWRPVGGRQAETRLGAGVTQLAWSRDDRLAVGTTNGEVAVFATRQAHPSRSPFPQQFDRVAEPAIKSRRMTLYVRLGITKVYRVRMLMLR
jgi:WD40 repeat protein